MDELEFLLTSDGSHTLLNKRLNETYHSVHGAARESAYVFIGNGLQFYHEQNPLATPASILEIGFGTGLNAWLTLRYAVETRLAVNYVSLEPFPLPESVWSKLNYVEGDRSGFDALHRAEWDAPQVIHEHFTVTKLQSTLEEFSPDRMYDVIFFDAFAPSRQAEMWEYPLLQKVVEAMAEPGVFVTYCAKGQVKRDLKALGLHVETLPGPPGKKEMIRATKGAGA